MDLDIFLRVSDEILGHVINYYIGCWGCGVGVAFGRLTVGPAL